MRDHVNNPLGTSIKTKPALKSAGFSFDEARGKASFAED
jgi:hypothetical protein